ncbi:MAG: DUF4156 domain-containing protein [Gammaproteobacteria bacterium]|nr:DUF4156 domain-containing protein [Gammaproteobacteria bacterium]
MLVIDCNTPGVTLERRFQSMDGSHHAAFRFDEARVPVTHLIGNPGEGLPRAMRQIGDTRLAIAAEAVGSCLWIVEFVTAHLLAPHHSGEPLGAREGVRLRYADLRIKTFAARSVLYRTARLAETGANIVNEGICAKVFATESLADVVDTAIQLVGGKALTVGHPLEKLYRSARALRLAEGASDVLRLNLAAATRSGQGKLMKTGIMAAALVGALTGCAWVKLDAGGATVRLITAEQATACERLGIATATTREKVIGKRDETKVKGELITLASNQAATLGANAIVPMAPPDKGIQNFIAYRCP